MRKMLEYQSDRIEAVLRHHKVPGRVTGGTVTPRWIRFKVLPAMGSRISRIKGLSEELAAALDAPSCRVARQGAAVMVEVPRDDARPVHLMPMMEQLEGVPPVTAVLGVAEDGAPLLIRLPSPDVAHILVAGTTGSGKTALLRTVVLSLAMRHPYRGQLSLMLIDPKGRAFADLGGLPQLARPVVVDGEEAAEALGSLIRLMERRDAMMQSEPPVVVVIDELVDLMMTDASSTRGGPSIEDLLTRLVQRGREAGIHIVAATQKPTAAVIGTLVKANFPVRMVGKVTSATDARVASGWAGTGAERLLGKGDFIAVAEGRVHRFQAAYISPQEAADLMASLSQGGLISLAGQPSQAALCAAGPVGRTGDG
jgi:S-DNA-T family DNA segregation ATPase FtsK/SpoIIIE